MINLEEYYNKFNEDKRLKSRHGIMEFTVTMKYVHKYLDILEKGEEYDLMETLNDHAVNKKPEKCAMENVANESIKVIASDSEEGGNNAARTIASDVQQLVSARRNKVDKSIVEELGDEHLITSDIASKNKKTKSDIRILDIGAATGGYSIPLWEEGYDVTAVELVKHNLGMLKAKGTGVKAFQGNALKLKRFKDDSFDLTLLFGPMYHLKTREKQLQALQEAKRVTRPGGFILVAYVMNEYAFLTYGIKEGHVLENIADGKLDEAFHVRPGADDLYAFMRTEDIVSLNEDAGLHRVQIISPDGPANHMRREVNALSEAQFKAFIQYQLAVCEHADLLGASAHTVDILQKV